MKDELDRMEQKLEELKMRKGTIAARAQQSRSGELGARGGSSAFENFRKMEEKIEGREQESLAMAEVEEAIGGGPDKRDLEDKFRSQASMVASDDRVDDALQFLWSMRTAPDASVPLRFFS